MCSEADNKTTHSEEGGGQPEMEQERLEVEEIVSSDSETQSSEGGVANSTGAEPADSDRGEEREEPSCSSEENEQGEDGKGVIREDDEETSEQDETACTECPESETEDAEDVPDAAYPECGYYRYLEDDLLPNSSIPLDLSNGESVELCIIPLFDEDAYAKAGQPEPCIRGCRSPDKSKVVMMWKVYDDLNQEYDYQSNWDDPPAPDTSCPYTIVSIPGKGTGMRAARDIGCGETILLERPILLFPSQIGSYEALEADLKVMVSHLEQKDQEAIEAMCNSKPSQCEELTGKILTNMMKCTFPQSTYATSYSGVCLDGSKANHSCSPNMIYEFNNEGILMEYRAARDIREGEELCISYIDPSRPFSDRQEYLQSVYGFRCVCDACSRVSASEVDIKVSDERREKVKEQSFTIAERWRKWLAVSLPGTTRIIEEYKELLSDIEEEGLYTYRPVPIRWLAYTYAALGDEEEFKKWCKEAANCFGILCATGKGFLDADIWKKWLDDPSSVPFWGIRQGNKWV